MRMDPIIAAATDSPARTISWRGYALIIAALLLTGIIAGGWMMQRFGKDVPALSDSRADAGAGRAAQRAATAPVLAPPAAPPAVPAAAAVPQIRGSAAVSEQLEAASTQAARAEALLVAVAARRALDRGLSLGYIEPLLRERFGASQPNAVQTIIAVSQKPVTLDNLRTRLEMLEQSLVMGGKHPDGFWAGVRRELGQLVVVQDANKPSFTPTERMARALRLLDSGRIDSAILDVEALSGKTLAPRWLDDARRYNEARRALDVIETAALVESRATGS
jgi:hypothetical protein